MAAWAPTVNAPMNRAEISWIFMISIGSHRVSLLHNLLFEAVKVLSREEIQFSPCLKTITCPFLLSLSYLGKRKADFGSKSKRAYLTYRRVEKGDGI